MTAVILTLGHTFESLVRKHGYRLRYVEDLAEEVIVLHGIRLALVTDDLSPARRQVLLERLRQSLAESR